MHYVDALYRLFTGREPDAEGFLFWSAYLPEHGLEQTIAAFRATDEVQSRHHVEFYSAYDSDGAIEQTGAGYSSIGPIHSADLEILGIADFDLV